MNNNNGSKSMAEVTMRTPFPSHQISKLPKPTKAQTDEVKADFKKGIRCEVCGGWHHPKVVHLDYVGHAALTDRLLDVDPNWTWEPLALDNQGLPAIDKDGGMWIKLTIKGITRLGYGDAQGKTGGDAMKERIGDALRNAAMRFGAALDLWHKGDLHIVEDNDTKINKDTGEISGSKHKPTDNQAFQPDAEEVKFLNGIIDEIIKLENEPALAADKFYGSGLDNDEKVYIWDALGKYSALRRKMKEIHAELKKKEGN